MIVMHTVYLSSYDDIFVLSVSLESLFWRYPGVSIFRSPCVNISRKVSLSDILHRKWFSYKICSNQTIFTQTCSFVFLLLWTFSLFWRRFLYKRFLWDTFARFKVGCCHCFYGKFEVWLSTVCFRTILIFSDILSFLACYMWHIT